MTDPTYRMSMLPLGTYANPDGTESLGLAVPGMIQEPVNALMRLFGSGNFAQGPDYPGNADDMRTLLFSMYGGNAMNPAGLVERSGIRDMAQGAYRDFKYADEPSPILKDHVITGAEYSYPVSVHPAFDPPPFSGELPANDTLFGTLYDHPPFEGAYGDALISQSRKNFQPNLSVIDGDLLSDTGKPSLMGSTIAGAEAPQRAYRGATNTGNLAREDMPMLWASSSPDVAGTYARPPFADQQPIGAVAPMDMNFSNPMVVDAQGKSWNEVPFNGNWIDSNNLAYWARDNGHDGLVIQNVKDAANRFKGEQELPPATTYVALKRGTVTSPLTGETLFSDTGRPSLWGNALAPHQDQEPRNALMDYAQNDQGSGDYLKKHMDQPYQPAPGEDFQYRQDPADVQRLQDWIGRHQRHDLPPKQAEELMKRDPEYQRLYRKLWTPSPYNPEPPLR